MTNTEPFLKNLTLITRTADCLPILIYTPTVIAAIHAGRKSTELKILEKVLVKMQKEFNINTHFHIYFGPHICKENYEINPETKEHYELRQQNVNQIQSVLNTKQYTLYEKNICTKQHVSTYFSYREEGGRFYSGISLR